MVTDKVIIYNSHRNVKNVIFIVDINKFIYTGFLFVNNISYVNWITVGFNHSSSLKDEIVLFIKLICVFLKGMNLLKATG